jgi:ribosomal protein S18 acetylase RimI-like enzyme
MGTAVDIQDFGGTEREWALLVELDELMCGELHEQGKPALPAYGRGWFEMRCTPSRAAYRSWHTLTLTLGKAGSSSGDGIPVGFCLFSRETMAAPSTGANGGGEGGSGGGRRRTAKRRRRRREAYMELFWIGIAVSQRGRGLGGQLLERAIAAARERWDDVRSVRLHVMANNAAVRFYERASFGRAALKKDYPPGYVTLRMVRPLPPPPQDEPATHANDDIETAG